MDEFETITGPLMAFGQKLLDDHVNLVRLQGPHDTPTDRISIEDYLVAIPDMRPYNPNLDQIQKYAGKFATLHD